MSYLKNEKKHIIYSIILGVIGSLIGISIFALSGYMISLSFFEPPIFVILFIIAVIKLFGMAKGGLKYLERLLSHNSTFKLISRMRSRYFESSLNSDEDMHSVRFIQTLSRYFEDIEDYYITIIYPYIMAALVSIFVILLAGLIDVQIVITALVLSLIMLIVFPLIFSIWHEKIDADYRTLDQNAFMKTYQFIHGFPDLFVDNKNKAVQSEISRQLDSIRHNKNKDSLKEAVIELLTGLAQIGTIVLIIFLMQNDDVFLIPMLILLVISYFEVLTPVVEPAGRFFNTHRKVGEIERPAPGAADGRKISDESITLENVSYKYPAGAYEALSDVDITVNPGEKHAIIGSSGSGKTTLLNQIIGQKDMAVMPQHLDFYNATIRDNLTMFGHFESSDEEMEHLLAEFELEHFKLDDFIYFTGQLSGGEKKRLHLIRMILEDKDWWVLDEPSAKLNRELQEKVWRKIFDTPTAIVSTHDLSHLDRFDVIHFMEAGRIIESGGYGELMARGGATAEAVRRFAEYL
ncbi:amino acid ABC transporter ATP-binding/permease protein [Salinicoccus halitifaciens]|uniref:ATP-binding cassette subfamily C protein CydC n=1 Tax=Salinicoccus halitifaciens TaxID=1073415 RepID=A0ABV2EBI0_9STAP|nr:ATP-binding cassette domain-containing protein [Salinicoccus halitifaciens]MCD2138900.1 ATP-binding cassette domain-containing protein [Salinicoccus halitifaciens]